MKPDKYKVLRKNMQMYKNLEEFLNNHEKYSRKYGWSRDNNGTRWPQHAEIERLLYLESNRRKLEFDNKLHFILEAGFYGRTVNYQYEFEQNLVSSNGNFYYNNTIHVNGKKKDIRAIKKLLNK